MDVVNDLESQLEAAELALVPVEENDLPIDPMDYTADFGVLMLTAMYPELLSECGLSNPAQLKVALKAAGNTFKGRDKVGNAFNELHERMKGELATAKKANPRIPAQYVSAPVSAALEELQFLRDRCISGYKHGLQLFCLCASALLSMSSSEAAVERTFSVHKFVLNKLRNRLSHASVRAELFIRFNKSLIAKLEGNK